MSQFRDKQYHSKMVDLYQGSLDDTHKFPPKPSPKPRARKNRMSEKRFYIKERSGWFNGQATHMVRDRELNCMICFSNEWSCECVADAMNFATTLPSHRD